MNWLYRLQTVAKVMGASYQIIAAAVTIFYAVKMSIEWDQPRRKNYAPQSQLRSTQSSRSFRRKN